MSLTDPYPRIDRKSPRRTTGPFSWFGSPLPWIFAPLAIRPTPSPGGAGRTVGSRRLEISALESSAGPRARYIKENADYYAGRDNRVPTRPRPPESRKIPAHRAGVDGRAVTYRLRTIVEVPMEGRHDTTSYLSVRSRSAATSSRSCHVVALGRPARQGPRPVSYDGPRRAFAVEIGSVVGRLTVNLVGHWRCGSRPTTHARRRVPRRLSNLPDLAAIAPARDPP